MNDKITTKQYSLIKNRVVTMRTGIHPERFTDWWTKNADLLEEFGDKELRYMDRGEASIIISFLFTDDWDSVMDMFDKHIKG